MKIEKSRFHNNLKYELFTGDEISDNWCFHSLFLDENSNEQQFATQDEIDFALIEQFATVGEAKENFEELSRKDAVQSEYFADVQQLSQLESNILNLIKKDKRITPEVIAETLKLKKILENFEY